MQNRSNNVDLVVIMPVYNEEECIIGVLEKWLNNLRGLKIKFEFHVYNDGSKDNTENLLKEYAESNEDLFVHNKDNSGHGPTILLGYQSHPNAKWLFEIDSDDEMSPEYFHKLWNERNKYDFLVGKRINRGGHVSRTFISFISRCTVRCFFAKGVCDVNVPYRLMKNVVFQKVFHLIPKDTVAPNVIITGVACKLKLKFFEYPVPYKFRQTGEVSIKKWKLLKVSFKSFLQTVKFALNRKYFQQLQDN